MIRSLTLAILSVTLLLGNVATGQGTPDDAPHVGQRMHNIIDSVVIDHATARQAFAWWSHTTGIPLVMDWADMENEGIDPDQTISLRLERVPADQLLNILMQQTRHDLAPLIAETFPWYVQVMTQRQANRHPVTRIYEVTDLLMEIPHFTNAPSLDLRDALSNTSTGASEQSLFNRDEPRNSDRRTTRQERGENLAQLIRESIEPTLWYANGGDTASITYLDGRLIVRAPAYIQQQIGIPRASPHPQAISPDHDKADPQTRSHAPSRVSGIAQPGTPGSSSISGKH